MALKLYKYAGDLPDECWAVEIGGDTLYLDASRHADGFARVEVNHGYERGTAEWRRECAMFDDNEEAIRAAAEVAIGDLEARLAMAPSQRR